MPRRRESPMQARSDVEPNYRIKVEHLDALIERQIRTGDVNSAVFWAEKRLAVRSHYEEGTPFYDKAQYLKILILSDQWKSAIPYIASQDLHVRHLVFAYFYVFALHKAGRFDTIVGLPIGHLKSWETIPSILPDTVAYIHQGSRTEMSDVDEGLLDDLLESDNLEARLLYLLAETFLHKQNRLIAAACIKEAIMQNPMSSEFFTFALRSHLVRYEELQEILLRVLTTDADRPLMNVLQLLLNYHSSEVDANSELTDYLEQALDSDPSLLTAMALKHYNDGEITEALDITSELVRTCGFPEDVVVIHVACLVTMNEITKLYELAHQIINKEQDKRLGFYTIACYYYAAEQYQMARKFFEKCTQVDPGFGYAWLAFGHAMAADKENELAMNCYLRASRLLENYPEVQMYIALESSHANSTRQAQETIREVIMESSIPTALMLNEQGCLFTKEKKYRDAVSSFMNALVYLTKSDTLGPHEGLMKFLENTILDSFWYQIYLNLGYCYLRLNMPCSAIVCLNKLTLSHKLKGVAWGHIGLAYANAGRIHRAIDALSFCLNEEGNHKAFKLANDRLVTLMSELPPFIGEMLESVEDLDDIKPPEEPLILRKIRDMRPNLNRTELGLNLNETVKIHHQQAEGLCKQRLAENRRMLDSLLRHEGINVGTPASSGRFFQHVRTMSPSGSGVLDTEVLEEATPSTETATPHDPDVSVVDDTPMELDEAVSLPPVPSTVRVDDVSEISSLGAFARDVAVGRRNNVAKRFSTDDPHEIMTRWFMEDIQLDRLRPSRTATTLGPPLTTRRLSRQTTAPPNANEASSSLRESSPVSSRPGRGNRRGNNG